MADFKKFILALVVAFVVSAVFVWSLLTTAKTTMKALDKNGGLKSVVGRIWEGK